MGTRTREVALRQAMGAGRGRLVRQFLVEAVVLAVAGGALGLTLTHLGTGLLDGLIPQDIYRVGEISLDRRVLAFSALVTLSNALTIDVGFSAEMILTAQLSLPESEEEDDPAVIDARFQGLMEGLSVPLEERPSAHYSRAGREYFEAMGITLLAGRTFRPEDGEAEELGVVVSRGLADRLWPGQSAVGQSLAYGRSAEPVTASVLGVVAIFPLVSAGAALIPARRASTVEPAEALRME